MNRTTHLGLSPVDSATDLPDEMYFVCPEAAPSAHDEAALHDFLRAFEDGSDDACLAEFEPGDDAEELPRLFPMRPGSDD